MHYDNFFVVGERSFYHLFLHWLTDLKYLHWECSNKLSEISLQMIFYSSWVLYLGFWDISTLFLLIFLDDNIHTWLFLRVVAIPPSTTSWILIFFSGPTDTPYIWWRWKFSLGREVEVWWGGHLPKYFKSDTIC